MLREVILARDFHPLVSRRPLGLCGVWTEPMQAPVVLGISELEPVGIHVGEELVVRHEREPFLTMIIRAARLHGTDQPFSLVYGAEL